MNRLHRLMSGKFYLAMMLTSFMSLFSAEAQDWPNLQRYQKENKELPEPTATEKRIVFMGNSITEGWFKADPDFFKGKSYVGRGISGQTTPQMLVRFRQDVIDLKPSAV